MLQDAVIVRWPGMCAINHLVANKNSACLPCVCQWRLHFPSMCLVCVANRACISLGSRFGVGETPSPSPLLPGLCGPQPPRAALPAQTHARGRASHRPSPAGPRAWGRGGGCSRVLAAPALRAQRAPPKSCPPRRPVHTPVLARPPPGRAPRPVAPAVVG